MNTKPPDNDDNSYKAPSKSIHAVNAEMVQKVVGSLLSDAEKRVRLRLNGALDSLSKAEQVTAGLKARNEELERECDELRKALEPFASVQIHATSIGPLTAEHFRRAREVFNRNNPNP
jgi:hypothetical protein